MRNWFSNCFPLLYICICWHFGAPDTPGFYVRAQHHPQKYSKGFYHIASIFDMQINLREGWCEPRWSQSDYWSPPPPRLPNSQRCWCFHIWKTYYLLVWQGLHDTLVPLDSTYHIWGPPPKIKKKLITNFHPITSIFYMLLEDSFGVKSILKFSWGLEAYI